MLTGFECQRWLVSRWWGRNVRPAGAEVANAELARSAQLELELGPLVVGPVQVFNLDTEAFDRYLHQVILPRFQAQEGAESVDVPFIDPPGATSTLANLHGGRPPHDR